VLVPEKYHTCQADIIVTLLADLINQIIQYNDQLTIQPRITRFHSRAVPGISVKDYLLRTVKYLQIDNSVLLLILVFIDRISKLNIVTINSLTIHRFIIASISIATKQVSDVYPPNSIFAKIGGLSLQELNLIEMELCKTLNWRFNCPDKLLQNYYTNLVLNHSQYGF
ncbi:cyclin-domain-containing protein, partial [Globomyces pollinis-pini]